MTPPENKRGGGAPSEHRPTQNSAAHHTAETTTIVGQDAVTGAASNARRRYAHAVELCRAAIAERARAAMDLGISSGTAETSLDLVRGQLVAEVNAIVDREARRRANLRRFTVALTSRRPR